MYKEEARQATLLDAKIEEVESSYDPLNDGSGTSVPRTAQKCLENIGYSNVSINIPHII